MFFATEPEARARSNTLSHVRDSSVCHMQTFGTLSKVRFINDRVVSTELKKLLREFSQDI